MDDKKKPLVFKVSVSPTATPELYEALKDVGKYHFSKTIVPLAELGLAIRNGKLVAAGSGTK